MYYIDFDTAIGNIKIVENDGKISRIVFFDKDDLSNYERRETPLLMEAKRQLDLYFKGELKDFDLPLDINGPEFFVNVYKELLKIPYGEVITYKELSKRVGNEKACRAVGNANNKNKIPIIIPCHRVIGSNKKLVGYAFGLDIKEKLINLEKGNIHI